MTVTEETTKGGLTFRSEPLPLARAVLWGPTGAGPLEPLVQPYPIFLHQQALRQFIVHTRAAPAKALLGFLLGDLYECPETRIRYVLIDQGVRVGAEVPGDHTSSLLAKVWPRLQEQIPALKRRPVGWYHVHPAAGPAFSREDIGTHLMYFAQPWQVALVLGTEDGKPAAGWFRASQDKNWATVRLPFYEVLSPDSIDSSGKKRSHVDWANFKPYRAVPPPPRKMPAPRPSVTAATPAARAVGSPPRPGATPTQAPAAPPPRPVPSPPRPAAAPARTPTAPSFRPPPPRPAAPPEEPEEEPIAEVPRVPPRPAPPPPVEEEPAAEEEPVAEEPAPEPPKAPARPPQAPYRPSVRFPARPSGATMAEHRREEPTAKPRPRWQLYAVGGAGAAATALLVLAGWGLGLVHFGRLPAPSQQAPGQAAAPAPAPVNPALVALDRITDSLLTAVRGYRERGATFDRGQKDCAPLAEGLVNVEGLWMAYNTRGKPRGLVLDAQRAARDQSLYAQVDTVESHFDASACPRP